MRNTKTSVEVETELRARILNQQLLPGIPLAEERLARELGTSRNIVRTALISLEARRLVERIPNRGAVVARLDRDRLFAIYDVLEYLEGLTARLAGERSVPEDWDELIHLFGPAMETAVEAGDYERYFDAVVQYRRTVSYHAANPYLAEVLSGIHDQVHTIIRRILIIPGRTRESLHEHQKILAALHAGDAKRAEQLKRENMLAARATLEAHQNFLL